MTGSEPLARGRAQLRPCAATGVRRGPDASLTVSASELQVLRDELQRFLLEDGSGLGASLEEWTHDEDEGRVPPGLLAELEDPADTAADLDERRERPHRRLRGGPAVQVRTAADRPGADTVGAWTASAKTWTR